MITMRKANRATTEDEAYKIVQKAEWAVLSMINGLESYPTGIGSPYGIAISHVLYEGAVYFHCATEGHKLENLKRDNRVSLFCATDVKLIGERFTTDFDSAVVVGTADMVTHPQERMNALIALTEKFAPTELGRLFEHEERTRTITQVWKITIKGISGKRHLTP